MKGKKITWTAGFDALWVLLKLPLPVTRSERL